MANSMTWWMISGRSSSSFSERRAKGGRHVIEYDSGAAGCYRRSAGVFGAYGRIDVSARGGTIVDKDVVRAADDDATGFFRRPNRRFR
jgi:hypothetical protein